MNFDWKFLMVPVRLVSDDVFASLNGMSCRKFDFENDVRNVCFGTMSMAFCTQIKLLNKARGFEWDMFTLHETKMASDGTCA